MAFCMNDKILHGTPPPTSWTIHETSSLANNTLMHKNTSIMSDSLIHAHHVWAPNHVCTFALLIPSTDGHWQGKSRAGREPEVHLAGAKKTLRAGTLQVRQAV